MLREGQSDRQPRREPEPPGRLPARDGRSAADLRHPVGAGHPERPALPAARGEEPGGGGGEPPQVRVPRQHVPRAAHAAQRHHRLQRDAGGRGPGPRPGAARPRPQEDQRGGQAPAGADQRRPRPLQDRGGQDGPLPRDLRGGRHGPRHRGGHPAAGGEEPEPARRPMRPGRRERARGPHQGAPGPLQSAEQRVQVHRGRRGRSRGREGGGGRRRPARLRGERYRDRDDSGASGADLPGVLAGRRLGDAALRRDGAGARAVPAARPPDGRRHRGGERSRERQHLHDAHPGGRDQGSARAGRRRSRPRRCRHPRRCS